MRVMIEFSRGRRCCHSGERQCAPCWKREMAAFLGSTAEDFEGRWQNRACVSASDETPETFSIYDETGFDLQDRLSRGSSILAHGPGAQE